MKQIELIRKLYLLVVTGSVSLFLYLSFINNVAKPVEYQLSTFGNNEDIYNSIWPALSQKMYTFGYENNTPLFPMERLYDSLDKFESFLQPTVVSNRFHYVWCGNRSFTFQNYLSILGAIRNMRPDNIVFYYYNWPIVDFEMQYNTWLDDLRENYPFIETKQIKEDGVCGDNDKTNMTSVLNMLGDKGGIYISEFVILTKPLDLNIKFHFRWDENTDTGFLQVAPGLIKNMSEEELLLKKDVRCPNVTIKSEKVYHDSHVIFDTPQDTLHQIENDICMVISDENYPRDFWIRNDILGQKVRMVMYGTEEIRLPIKHPNIVVPNIAHVLWVHGGKMDYLFYLSILSIVYIQRVDAVYIHGNLRPSGEYWDRLENISQVIFKYRSFDPDFQVYGNRIYDCIYRFKIAHISDVIRTDVMLKWGGIYVDTDAIFVKKLDEEYMKYDMVSHYSMARRLPYPDTFVNGLMLAKPGSEFFVKFQDSMRRYDDSNWMYNSLLVPYKIMERYPWLVRIEPHLQVVCLKELCHPTWIPNFKNMSLHHRNTDSLKDWQNDAHVYHFCSNTTPKELKNETALLQAPEDSMFAQMGRLILKNAGLWPPKEKSIKKENI